MDKVSISVVIAVETGGEPLDRMLAHLETQRLAGTEVLIIDTRERPQPVNRGTLHLQWHHLPKETFAYAQQALARNFGLQAAQGDVVVFMDEGLLVKPDFLERHWAYHQTAECNCVIGPQVSIEQETSLNAADGSNEGSESLIAGLSYAWLQERVPWALLDGGNFSVKRMDLQRVGGYDVEYAIYEKGDAELGYRLWKTGTRVVYSHACRAFRPPLTTFPKTRWRGEGLDYVHYKHPELHAWARLRQVLLGVRDHNFYASEPLAVSSAFLRKQCREQPASEQARRQADSPDVAFVVRDGHTLPGALERFAQARPSPHAHLLVLDATKPAEKACVEITCTTAPFPIQYHPLNYGSEIDPVPCADGVSRLTQLLSRDCADTLAGARTDIREFARRAAHANHVVFLEPKAVQERTPLYPVALADASDNCRAPLQSAGPSVRPKAPAVSRRGASGSIAEGYSYPPRTVSFKLTNLCNLRCEMCGQWGPHGNVFRQDSAALREQLGLSELCGIIDQVAEFSTGMIYVWGGEPFLHPDFLEFIAYIRSKGLYCSINTNGTRLLETAQDLVDIGPQFMRISLDGPAPVHDRIRGRSGTFAHVVDGIRAVDRLKRERDTFAPVMQVDCTITPTNYACLDELIPPLEDTGIYRLTYSHLVYVPHQVGEAYAALLQQLFGCEAHYWRGFVNDPSSIDTDCLVNTIGRLENRKNGIPIAFAPPMRSPADIRLHYRDANSLYRNRYCCAPWLWAEVHPDGSMAFCDDFPDYVLGDVRHDSFLSIWNGERARRFRRELHAHKRWPICVHCGFLHHDAVY